MQHCSESWANLTPTLSLLITRNLSSKLTSDQCPDSPVPPTQQHKLRLKSM